MKVVLLLLVYAVLSVDISRADDMKIATVDVRKVFDNWNFSIKSQEKHEAIKALFDKQDNDRLAAISERQMLLSRITLKYRENGATMSVVDKRKAKSDFDNIQRELKALRRDRSDFTAKQKRKHFDDESSTARLLLERITEAIQVYALEKKYHMVIEMGGHTTRSVPLFLHLEGAVDISDEIITRLNQ